MKYLSIFVLVALVAFAPNTRASGGKPDAAVKKTSTDPSVHPPGAKPHAAPEGINPHTTIPPETLEDVVSWLPETGRGAFAQASKVSNAIVEQSRDETFRINFISILNSLGVDKPIASIQQYVAARESLADKNGIPLKYIIEVVGPDELRRSPNMATKLVKLATPSPHEHATEGIRIAIISDPHSLFQLVRAVPDNSVDELIKQNAALFKGGLGIDETWDGDLKWFLKYLRGTIHPEIIFSHDDVSRILCYAMCLKLDPQVLTGQLSVTQVGIASVLKLMVKLADAMATHYDAHSIRPPLEVLLQLKPELLEADLVKFDPTLGAKACLAKPPRIGALIAGLDSLYAGKKVVDDPARVDKFNILSRTAKVAGMDLTDMMWAMCSPLSRTLSNNELLFEVALKALCPISLDGALKCSSSPYYLTAPGNGVLDPNTLSLLLKKVSTGKCYATYIEMAKMLVNYSLIHR